MLPGLNVEEMRDLILSLGTHRSKRRLSPVEIAYLFDRAIKNGATPEICAEAVGFQGTTMVHRFLKLLKLNTNLHYLIGWGQSGASISFTAASDIARLSADEQVEAFDVAISNQMSKTEVQSMVQLRKRSGKTIGICAMEIIGMRPEVAKMYVFIGSVTDQETRKKLSLLKQADRNELLNTSLIELYGPLTDTTGRLGIERFTVVTNETDAVKFHNEIDSNFEAKINKVITSRVFAQ